MKNKALHSKTITILALALLLTMFSGCGLRGQTEETPVPAATAAPAGTAEPAGPRETEAERQDGERFEEVIILEGMEEAVRYEHIRNDAVGIEMDYDYERFDRRSGSDRECFVSIWDDPEHPENYLEVTYRPEDADIVAAAVGADLSRTYDLHESMWELDRAGICRYIEASVLKGTNNMADQLQAVYIIPASDGCRVAAAHFAAEAAEGFARRFFYMVNTLAVIDSRAEMLSDDQALSAVRNYCFISNPDLESIVSAGEYAAYWDIASSGENEVVVLFRSYTGAQLRYYIDRITGETYVTEFVPGITAQEQQTEERFNARDYLLSVPGTWQTASMAYEADGTMQPEFYVRFTDAEIFYGHMEDGAFVPDHADKIILLAENAAGGFKVQAEASNGVRYTYRTAESDDTVMEYYETWNEADFPEMYRGGASLMKCPGTEAAK